MLEHPSGFPRARTLLPETADPPSISAVSACAGKPDVCADADAGSVGDDAIAQLVASITQLEEIQAVTTLRTPARIGEYGRWPEWIDARVQGCFAARGVEQPYAHQQAALDVLAQGRDVVLATETASGKSLCYQAPVLQAVVEDPSARALFLFPTKALGRDQVEALRRLVGPGTPLHECVGASTYDGDTPPDQRRAARARAHVIASNADMLHRGILPHHDRWAAFFAGLRYVVIDELHSYRGVFGSHVANVLRRLWRVCAFHGSRPQIVACSATIANPRELAESLCARSDRSDDFHGSAARSQQAAPSAPRDGQRPTGGFTVIDRSSAPVGPRTFVVLNPAVVDPLTGVRRDYLKCTRVVLGQLRRADLTTLAFCRTRKAVELLTRYLREDEAAVSEHARSPLPRANTSVAAGGRASKPIPAGAVGPWARMYERRLRQGEREQDGNQSKWAQSDVHDQDRGFRRAPERSGPVDPGSMARARRRIRGYRGGYLPEHRREIEAALREGEAKIVTSTNALELGMDIGGLDAVVLAGYPGTRAATWQRSGRAGRRQSPALTILVLSSRPLDQFVAAAPEFLFAEPPEHARLDALNPEVLIPHLRCAAYELPFASVVASGIASGASSGEAGQSAPWWASWGELSGDELSGALDYLAERGALLRASDRGGRAR